MQAANQFALKEWAAVCHALQMGRQTILLRSGGIADGRDGFAIQHTEFWLFATRFHQSADELTEDAAPLIKAVGGSSPPPGKVRLPLYATLERVLHVHEEGCLAGLAARHILAPQTVLNRFHYRRPGLTILLVRTYRPPQAIDVDDAPHFAGCHSWVELPSAIPTDGLQPVLSDDEFAAAVDGVSEAVRGST